MSTTSNLWITTEDWQVTPALTLSKQTTFDILQMSISGYCAQIIWWDQNTVPHEVWVKYADVAKYSIPT